MSFFENVKFYSIHDRPSKVMMKDFGIAPIDESFKAFVDSLPRILAAKELRDFADIVRRSDFRIWGIGGHVIKVGLGPVLIDLMQRGFIQHLAMTTSALIHDVEIALAGKTSEDVDASLQDGSFGFAREPAELINGALGAAHDALQTEHLLIPFSISVIIAQSLDGSALSAFLSTSVIWNAFKLAIPVSIHHSIGTDVLHIHPSYNPTAWGRASYWDFKRFCDAVSLMHPSGIYMNWGSHVLLPECFLKAVSVCRNKGVKLDPIFTANFDFIQHYRTAMNVVKRPVAGSNVSRGFSFTGHHEIMLPLFAAMLRGGMRNV